MRNGWANPFGICFYSKGPVIGSRFLIATDKQKSVRISSTIPHSSFLIPNYLKVVALRTMALIWALSSSAVRPERICSDSS